jgi:FAD/FMN-containing dehydrogenase
MVDDSEDSPIARRTTRADPDYARVREAIVWNDLVPDRFPDLILRVAERAEVATAVKEAAAGGRRVAVKSGGHNWLGSALRDGALLLDLSDLDRVEVDVAAKRATVEPGATHKKLADAIVPHGLAFPIGHCPTVGLGGYLLAGGNGWNMHEWGPGCWNVVGADLVTAAGEEVFVDGADPDLFWALRGGSAGFPGVVTRFHLRLFDLPRVVGRRVAFPVVALEQLLPWVAGRLAGSPPGIEISLIARTPPGASAARVTVAATGFGPTDEAAAARIEEALAELPADLEPLEVSDPEAMALNDLEGEGGWVEGLRYFADTCWVSAGYAEIGRELAAKIEAAPSPLARIVFAFGFMPAAPEDVAFTRFGDLTVNVYGTWEDKGEDAANIAWVRETMEPVSAFVDGYYVGETDLSISPLRITEAYPAEKWARLGRIIEARDPERRFHAFVGED